MDGQGGARQDITWQQYNGSRRSKFYADDEVYASDFGPGGHPSERKEEKRKVPKDMWTEVTKDLVIKEAIEEMGYEFEDTEHFFYVMEYLKYVSPDQVPVVLNKTTDLFYRRMFFNL